jgi:hypothetical protein
MPWITRPFDYYGTSTNQILEDLTQANDNFEILGNCFVNNDPTTGKAKEADTIDGFHASQTPTPNTIPVAGPDGKIDSAWLNLGSIGNFTASTRVDLSNATEDYPLAVGEEAIINFTNATSMPLHIATQNGTVYEMHLIPSNPVGTSGGSATPTFLNPNNNTYSNAFKYADLSRTSFSSNSGYFMFSAFRIGWAFTSLFCVITNKTIYKNIKGFYDVYGVSYSYPLAIIFSTDWQDTITAWTSLGTIAFPQPSSGQILIRRVV